MRARLSLLAVACRAGSRSGVAQNSGHGPGAKELACVLRNVILQRKGGRGDIARATGRPARRRVPPVFANGFDSDLPQLTPTERRIVELLLCAQSSDEIACALNRAPRTIKHHFSNVYRKFGLRGNALYVPRLKLAMLIHERHEALGVRCQTCEYLAAKSGDGLKIRQAPTVNRSL
jgi:DNA-binding CsgD family transcriptional regulator